MEGGVLRQQALSILLHTLCHSPWASSRWWWHQGNPCHYGHSSGVLGLKDENKTKPNKTKNLERGSWRGAVKPGVTSHTGLWGGATWTLVGNSHCWRWMAVKDWGSADRAAYPKGMEGLASLNFKTIV